MHIFHAPPNLPSARLWALSKTLLTFRISGDLQGTDTFPQPLTRQILLLELCAKHCRPLSRGVLPLAAQATLDADVVGGANHGPRCSCIGRQHFGDAKVSKLQNPPATAEDVVALQVSVNDALCAVLRSFTRHLQSI